jgi:HIRAN domain-containing protein
MAQNRVLYVAWRSHENRAIYPVARVVRRSDAPPYEFAYIRGAREAAAHGFLPFIGFPDLESVYRSDELLPPFQTRLMPSKRPDYREYVESLGLDPETAEPLTVIARSSQRGITDQLEIFGPPEYDSVSDSFTYRFFLRSIRYLLAAAARIERLTIGEPLYCMLDVQNRATKDAVALRTEDVLVGYLPRYLNEDLYRVLLSGAEVSVFVERVNLPPAPVQHRVLCRLVVTNAQSFEPFSGAWYEPLSPQATLVRLRPTSLAS